VTNAWTRRDKLPQPLGPNSRPPAALLTALRARIEQGCPLDLARRACGIPEHVHEAWLAAGEAIRDARPDRLYHDGGCVIGGSDEPEAEYARIVSTVQAGVAADLVGSLWGIAKDPARKRDQLVAITTLLRGMGERAFDPRTEADVNVTATTAAPAMSQAAIDAMTPEEIALIRTKARALSADRAAVEATVQAAEARAIAAPVAPPEPRVTD